MIIRIVKLTFKEAHIKEFLDNFKANKDHIRSFEGCRHLELWNDESEPNIFFTYSHWTSQRELDSYRHSELFNSVWAKTKPLFADKPQAWSVNRVSEGLAL